MVRPLVSVPGILHQEEAQGPVPGEGMSQASPPEKLEKVSGKRIFYLSNSHRDHPYFTREPNFLKTRIKCFSPEIKSLAITYILEITTSCYFI